MWMQPVYQWRFAHMYLKDRPVRWYQPPQAPSYHVSPLIYANEGVRVFQRLDVTPELCDGERIRELTKARTLNHMPLQPLGPDNISSFRHYRIHRANAHLGKVGMLCPGNSRGLLAPTLTVPSSPCIHSLGTYHLPCAGARTLCIRHCMRRNPRSGL